MGRENRGWRTIIRKCSDAGQPALRDARHRGRGQNKGAGKDESEDPHDCLRFARADGPMFAGQLTNPRFRTFTQKLKNGFFARENCFVARLERNKRTEIHCSIFSATGEAPAGQGMLPMF